MNNTRTREPWQLKKLASFSGEFGRALRYAAVSEVGVDGDETSMRGLALLADEDPALHERLQEAHNMFSRIEKELPARGQRPE